jgi:hypothetical protein
VLAEALTRAPVDAGFLADGDALLDGAAAERGLAAFVAGRLAEGVLVALDLEEGVAVLGFMSISSAERGTGGSNALCAKSINYRRQ